MFINFITDELTPSVSYLYYFILKYLFIQIYKIGFFQKTKLCYYCLNILNTTKGCIIVLQVGFVMVYVVDNGRSIVDQAFRVSPKHQDKGIASPLLDRGMKIYHDVKCRTFIYFTNHFALQVFEYSQTQPDSLIPMNKE